MAQDQEKDPSQQTQEPTERRLREARKKGQIVLSREVNTWFVLVAGVIAFTFMSPKASEKIVNIIMPFIAYPDAFSLDEISLGKKLNELIMELGIVIVPVLLFLLVFVLVGGGLQTNFLFARNLLLPKLERISLKKGLKRLFSFKSLVELVKGVFKIGVVCTIAVVVLSPFIEQAGLYISIPMADNIDKLYRLLVSLLSILVVVLGFIALLDYFYQRYEYFKNMRMTREEVKQEAKETEGDPLIRSRLRQLRREMARQRITITVPEATVIITNPTHYAIALKYIHGEMEAPVVTAKGIDFLALRIREIATSHNVPIFQNPPLAQALYNIVEIDEEIPPEHYKAVAEIIRYIMNFR